MGVDIEDHPHATVVTMRWADRRNALGPAEISAVADALAEAGQRSATCLVLTGEGAFCAGGDLASFAELSAGSTVEEIRTTVYGEAQRIVRTLGACPRPTIAAVDGPAIGLGMDIALACDMRFVGPRGWLQQGWGRAGLIPGVGGAALLATLAPALLWKLLAEQPRLDATACAELGLGETAGTTALEAALARAEALAAIPPDVLAAYVDLSRPLRWPSDAHFDASATYQAGFIGSERFRATAAAFLGATPPG